MLKIFTKPLVDSRSMLLNVAVQEGGCASVEVLGNADGPKTGYALKDCVPVKDDVIDQVGSRKTGARFRDLSSKVV